MFFYSAFGFQIASDFQLPPLISSSHTAADITVSARAVDPNGLEAPDVVKPLCQIQKDKLWLHIPNVAYFLIEDGRSITYQKEPGCDDDSLRLFILGSCFGAVFHQRGCLVLHANAIKVGDDCVVFMGPSGNGKSSLAAGFYLRGYPILTDDVAVVDSEGYVYSGYPQLKLWADVARRLQIDTAGLHRIRPQVEKFAFPTISNFVATRAKLRAAYVLSTHNQDDIVLSRIAGMAKFNPLKNNTYRINYVKGLHQQPVHFQLISTLAQQIQLFHISRPKAHFCLDEMISLLEAHWVSELGVSGER